MSKRVIVCADALEWLQSAHLQAHDGVVASLPDISEFPHLSLAQWSQWFVAAATSVLAATHPAGTCAFLQTDIKIDGRWVDKAYLVQKAAEALRWPLAFHKVIARVPVGSRSPGRPGYSHLLVFSRQPIDVSRDPLPDLLATGGDKTWTRGMGIETSLGIAKLLRQVFQCQRIVNPFCGEGSLLAAASYLELDSIGIERSAKRARKAQRLELMKSASEPTKLEWKLKDVEPVPTNPARHQILDQTRD